MKKTILFQKLIPFFLLFLLFLFFNVISNSAFAAHKKHESSFAKSRSAVGKKVFIFDPKTLQWAIYDGGGHLVRTGHGVGGRGYCPDVHRRCTTPVGTFYISSKVGPGFRSSKFPPPHGGAPMPWAMFFRGGYAIHGSNDVPNYNASHGCIRVYPSDAKWMNTQFLPIGSMVIVRSY